MPGGSSVRSFNLRSLKPKRNRNSQPSLNVGHTELAVLLHFICFQESFKRRRVLESCSWSMREAVAPLRCWSRPGPNHGLWRQRVSMRAKTRATNKSNIKPFHTICIHMCTRLSNKANDRVAESSHIGKAGEAHFSPKLVPIPSFYPSVGKQTYRKVSAVGASKNPAGSV